MATDLVFPIFDEAGALVTTGAYDLRLSDWTSAGVSGTFADGSWTFDNVPNGKTYRLFNTTAGTYAGMGGDSGFNINDGFVAAADITAGTFSGQMIFSTAPHVPTASGTGDAIPYEQGAKLATAETITGNWTFSNGVTVGTLTVGGAISLNITSTYRPQIGSGATTNKDSAGAIRRYDEIQADIQTAINNLPQSVPISPYERWIMHNVTEIPGKIYNTVLAAVDNILSVATPSSTARYKITVHDSGATGYRSVPHTAIKDYIDIEAKYRGINLVIGGTGESLSHTKTMDITGFKLWFGNGVLVGARSYANIGFIDCDVYAYNDFTIGGTGRSVGTNWYSGTGNTPTVTGTVELADTDFTQAITFTTYTGIIKRAVTDESNTGITMPTDPTSGA